MPKSAIFIPLVAIVLLGYSCSKCASCISKNGVQEQEYCEGNIEEDATYSEQRIICIAKDGSWQ